MPEEFTYQDSQRRRATLQIEMLNELNEMRGTLWPNDQHRGLAGSQPPGEPVTLWLAACAAYRYASHDNRIPTPLLQRLIQFGMAQVKTAKGTTAESICTEREFADRLARKSWRV